MVRLGVAAFLRNSHTPSYVIDKEILPETAEQKGSIIMAEKMFMRVEEVAEALEVSIPYAYKLIRQLNEELKKTGCITISGRIDRAFFQEKFYITKMQQQREA